ncbi:hypothetical protein PENTCL1PPCAC_11799, partial [Pristionchus entomophagus]
QFDGSDSFCFVFLASPIHPVSLSHPGSDPSLSHSLTSPTPLFSSPLDSPTRISPPSPNVLSCRVTIRPLIFSSPFLLRLTVIWQPNRCLFTESFLHLSSCITSFHLPPLG